MPTVTIDERGTARPLAPLNEATGRRRRVLIISPGQGSSGYYSPEVLERDGPRVIRAGTHMYLDHPSRTEAQDRPERTVRDLAAVLETDAVWDGEATPPGLYSEMRTFAHIDPIVDELADHIGVSIRGGGEKDRDGNITKLAYVESVDLVTKAGRGGRVLELLESALPTDVEEARNVGDWFAARTHQQFTIMADDMAAEGYLTRDERIALSAAIGDALASFHDAVMDSAPHLYERDPYSDPTDLPSPTTTMEADVPTNDTTTTTPDLSALMDRIAALEADRDEARAERDTEKARADALAEAQAAAERTRTARATVTEALGHIQFATDAMRDDVVTALAGDAPVTEAGTVDTDKLRERVAARYPTPAGSSVTGLGESTTTTTPPDTTAADELREANDKAALAVFA